MSRKREIMLLENQLCFALYTASHMMTRAYRPYLDRMDITYPQYLVLLVLWEDPDQTVTSLCDRLMLNTSTLTPLLKRLQANGAITRTRSKDDGRAVNIRLSEQGAALFNEAHAMLQKIICSINMEANDVLKLRGHLKDLTGKLDAIEPETTRSVSGRQRVA